MSRATSDNRKTAAATTTTTTTAAAAAARTANLSGLVTSTNFYFSLSWHLTQLIWGQKRGGGWVGLRMMTPTSTSTSTPTRDDDAIDRDAFSASLRIALLHFKRSRKNRKKQRLQRIANTASFSSSKFYFDV